MIFVLVSALLNIPDRAVSENVYFKLVQACKNIINVESVDWEEILWMFQIFDGFYSP